MKKKFRLIVSLILATTLIGTINADGMLDFLEYAASQTWAFGYSSNDRLNIVSVNNSSIDIDSPIIKNWWNDITSYLFSVSTERAYWNPVGYRCFDQVNTNWNKFSVELDTSDLDRSDIYYVYAVPLDGLTITWVYNGPCNLTEAKQFLSFWKAWNSSTENWEDPCFIINDKYSWDWLDCERHTSWGSSSSSSTVYSISNVSHVYDGDNIKLTWYSFANVNLDIFLRDESKQTFTSLWTVNSEQRYFTFKKRHDWDHIVKIKPQDWTQEINYTAHYKETATPQVKPSNPVKPVVVWPKENIMLILFGTLILYIVYRVATRKRD